MSGVSGLGHKLHLLQAERYLIVIPDNRGGCGRDIQIRQQIRQPGIIKRAGAFLASARVKVRLRTVEHVLERGAAGH